MGGGGGGGGLFLWYNDDLVEMEWTLFRMQVIRVSLE